MAQFDLIVIGGGPAGYVGAIRAAQLGAKVAVIEERELGGTCLNRGCIPTKALIHSAHLLDEAAGGRRFGIKFAEPEVDYDGIRKHAERCVRQLVSGVAELLKANRITTVKGRGRLAGPNQVTVCSEAGQEKTVDARFVLLATGSVPFVLPIPGADGEGVFTSDEAVTLPGPFARLAIIGAGAIGCEFAYVYSRLGTKVTLVEMLERIVPAEDPEVTDVLARSLKKSGVSLQLSARCSAIEHTAEGKRLCYEQAGEAKVVEADAILMAAGRRALTGELGLEAVGVATDRGRITIDDALRTSVPSVYAAGDCLRGIGLAHQASHEAVAATETMFGEGGHINYGAVPAVVYTYPQISSVGLREHEARERGIAVRVGTCPFAAIGKAAVTGEREGMVKLVADAASGQVIGASAVGPDVSELMAEITLAVEMGCTLSDVGNTIHSHPTLSEAVGEAALAGLGRAIHVPS